MAARRSGRKVQDLRTENRAAILRELYFEGPTSRQELGPATGLSAGSVSTLVADLVAENLVQEAGSIESEGGRPRILLRIVPRSGYLIGVDVGETRLRIELFDLALAELARVETPLELKGHPVDLVAGHIADGIGEVLATGGVAAEQLLGVGIGVPGIVAQEADGAVVHGQTIGWDAVPLEALLRRTCQLPSHVGFFVDNGAMTLGQAEMWFGAGRGAKDAVVVLFGSGVGACVVAGGAPRSVEWGHLTVHVQGRRCRCGAVGCLEAYAGAEALLERWQEAGGRPPGGGASLGGAQEEVDLTSMLAAAYPADDAQRPDATAVAVLEETAEYLGAGLSGLINLFRPERILVGGWAGLQLGDRFLDTVRQHVPKYALAYPAERVDLRLGRLGPDAVTVGAATLPLAAFFARGGRSAAPARVAERPAWQTTLRQRALP
ncbi:ROK family transcriptional regulator [Streptomyces triticagri]|uniref:ROK family transcriptional regulator n=1 Tax=Streptomyces triticagri TaxID=2293568 RepID=A0A372M2N0_9ACTN|nr:ROK family transcriptional regulator [Streptomyces triticagri]RFU84547.1 ROK family transcriptional regulator [Streptomyces triticagri]